MSSYFFLIGPLPPPRGGARTSFDVFFKFLSKHYCLDQNNFLDLPVRFNRKRNPAGKVNHLSTLIKLFAIFGKISTSKVLVVFCSRNFLLTFGLLLTAWCRIVNIPIRFRPFGGHPLRNLESKGSLKKLLVYLLELADSITVETKCGIDEAPETLRPLLRTVPGYRSRTCENGEGIDLWLHNKIDCFKFVYAGIASVVIKPLNPSVKSLNSFTTTKSNDSFSESSNGF